MPKSRKKRKKQKSKRSRSDDKLNEAKTVSPPLKTKKSRESFIKFLYRNDAEGLCRLIRFFPLFSGAWVAAGFVLDQVWNFVIVTAVMILSYFTAHPEKRQDFIFSYLINWIFAAICVGLLLFLNLLTDEPIFVGVCAATALLVYFIERVEINSVRSLLLVAVERIIEMSLFSFLSIYSQILSHENIGTAQYFWEFGILGFVPASCLAAAIVVRNVEILEKAEWRRVLERSDKKRPGGISQLYSLLLILGPAIPVILVPLAVFPSSFLIIAISVVSIPKLCQDFFEQAQTDEMIYIKTLNIAVFVSFLVALSALLANVL